MAPALPVYTREEIERMYPNLKMVQKDIEDIPENCEIYKLIQNECTYDGNKVTCLPFKRIFLRCLEKKGGTVIGYKLQPKHEEDQNTEIYRNIEITKQQDNNHKISKDIEEFLKADCILKDKMKEYYNKYKE